MKIVFSLVLYRHSLDSIRPLLLSIQKLSDITGQYSYELAIYNACPHESDDPSPSRVRSILNISSLTYQYGRNIGFGSANNRNFSSSMSEEPFLFIVVNPDICFEPSSLLPLLDWTISNPMVSCVSPLILNSGGRIQCSAKHNPTFLSLLLGRLPCLKRIALFDKYDKWHRNLDCNYVSSCIESTYLSGCFLVIPSYFYRKVGGFSEKYFLHLEDADIVRKLARYGVCKHNPIGSVSHIWARGSHSSLLQMFHLAYSYLRYSMAWGIRLF
jgi:GT2 family glycosyltransferase